MSVDARPLIIACGALVSELRSVLEANQLTDVVEVRYLPANLHNRPEGIVPALREHLDKRESRQTFVGYADCGTGGLIDAMLVDYPGVQRIAGAHCYEFLQEANCSTNCITISQARSTSPIFGEAFQRTGVGRPRSRQAPRIA